MKTKILMLTAAAVMFTGAAYAEETKIRTETYTNVQDLPHVNEVNFSEFDVNEDGKYSMTEVGERLFQSFDQDGNASIDNKEWTNRAIMTITPIEKETFQYVDIGNDGDTDYTNYKYNVFYKESGLMEFDKNKNGLSANEFIDRKFQALDSDDNNLISMEEWKLGYLESRMSSALRQNYNN